MIYHVQQSNVYLLFKISYELGTITSVLYIKHIDWQTKLDMLQSCIYTQWATENYVTV